MREIKFRLWDDIDKRMISWEEIDVLDQEGIYPFLQMLKDKKTLMQYIGLKDKNGREIYEGDVISVKGEKWLVEHIGAEERDGNRYGLCVSYKGDGICHFIDRSILEGEVIGNIYENPELLFA